ncbi:MAG: hydroxyacid dehydrogenase [Planctomycetota bacterium]
MEQILVNCPLHASGIDYLKDAGYEVHVVPVDDDDASLRLAPECVATVANARLGFDESFFAIAKKMKVVGRLGVGYDNVDVPAATAAGVRVVNTPLPVIEPVAEHAFSLMLALTRAIVDGDRGVRDGRFRAAAKPTVELLGKTLGILGMGNTGKRVAEIGHRGFGMNIVYADLAAREDVDRDLGARHVSLDELLETSDFISIHVGLNDATRHLIDANALTRMKSSAFLVNMSRGPVVDVGALERALLDGQIAGAGLDVFHEEPPPVDHPLLQLDNVVLSPHRGGLSAEGQVGCAKVAHDVVRVLRGEEPEFPVN